MQGQFLDFLHDGRVPAGASDVDVVVVQDDLLPRCSPVGAGSRRLAPDGYVVLTRQG